MYGPEIGHHSAYKRPQRCYVNVLSAQMNIVKFQVPLAIDNGYQLKTLKMASEMSRLVLLSYVCVISGLTYGVISCNYNGTMG